MPIRLSVGLLRLYDLVGRVGGNHSPARLPPKEPIIITTKDSESITLPKPNSPVLAGGVANDGSAHAISRPTIKQSVRRTRTWRVDISGCIDRFIKDGSMR